MLYWIGISFFQLNVLGSRSLSSQIQIRKKFTPIILQDHRQEITSMYQNFLPSIPKDRRIVME